MEHSFDPPAPAAADGAPPQRAASRDSMFLHAQLRRTDEVGDGMTLRVRNLSPGGMMVETLAPFADGETVKVELRNIGEVPGRIAWVRSGRVGIAFDRPIDPRDARKAAPASAGSTMLLIKPLSEPARRPGLKIG